MTPEQIAELRALLPAITNAADAIGCNVVVASSMLAPIRDALPALLDLAERAATARAEAIRECAEIVRDRLFPKNDERDWTEFARIRAEAVYTVTDALDALLEKQP